MSDLIERQKAIAALTNLTGKSFEEIRNLCSASIADSEGWLGGLKDAIEAIEALPSAEPERHRGEWIEDGHESGFSECSKCGYIAVSVLSDRHYNFCPNCGTDMRINHE